MIRAFADNVGGYLWQWLPQVVDEWSKVSAAMLDGWRDQQVARHLSLGMVSPAAASDLLGYRG